MRCQIHCNIFGNMLYGRIFDNEQDCLAEVIKLNKLSIVNGFDDIHYSVSHIVY